MVSIGDVCGIIACAGSLHRARNTATTDVRRCDSLGGPWALGLPLPKRSFCLFLLGVLALNRLDKAQQFRRHQHLNIIRWYQMNMFCEFLWCLRPSQLHNKLVCRQVNLLGSFGTIGCVNCAHGDRYRVIRHGSDLGFVALEDGRPMPRDQRDENPMSEGSEGLELPLKHAQGGEDLTMGLVWK